MEEGFGKEAMREGAKLGRVNGANKGRTLSADLRLLVAEAGAGV